MPDYDKSPEEWDALREDLDQYTNPDSFYDADTPLIHNLLIYPQNDPDGRIVLDVDITGPNLASHLREYALYHLHTFAEDEMISYYNAKDWEDARAHLLADPEFQDSEFEMYYFFARHFPKLLLKVYNLLLQMTLMSAIRKGQDERKRRQQESNMKETLASAVKEIERDIYTMLEATSKGRPLGSTKSPEEKAQAAAEFKKKVEDAIRRLRSESGMFPTKTAVAKELGIGGLSPRTGTDSSLTSFNNKLKRLELDYNEIVDEITD
jgi:hypothetical protein